MTIKSGTGRVAIVALSASLVAFATTLVFAQADQSAMMATYICRPAMAGEAASAKMMASAQLLECKPIAMTEHMSDGSMKTIGNVKATPSGPDFSGALTAQQANAAYNAWVNKTFHIDPAREHTN
jgi:hypothetical protein